MNLIEANPNIHFLAQHTVRSSETVVQHLYTLNLFYKQQPNEKYSRQLLDFDSGCLFWGKIFIESLLIFALNFVDFLIISNFDARS